MVQLINPFVLAQLINFLFLFAWLGLFALALLRMRHAGLGDGARALWAILIVFVPILGPLAFLIVERPKPKT